MLVIVLCLATCWFVLREIKVRNVFDEMYYGHEAVNTYHWTQASYRDVLYLRHSSSLSEYKIPGYISEAFPPTLIDEDTRVSLGWYLEEGSFKIQVSIIHKWDEDSENGYIGLDREMMFLYYQYNTKEKKMIYQPIALYSNSYKEEGKIRPDDPEIISQYMQEFDITREDISNINETVIFETLLPMWFHGNEGKTNYSMENLGKLEIVNNQFPDAESYEQSH